MIDPQRDWAKVIIGIAVIIVIVVSLLEYNNSRRIAIIKARKQAVLAKYKATHPPDAVLTETVFKKPATTPETESPSSGDSSDNESFSNRQEKVGAVADAWNKSSTYKEYKEHMGDESDYVDYDRLISRGKKKVTPADVEKTLYHMTDD